MRLSLNASDAAALLRAEPGTFEPTYTFLPLDALLRELRTKPGHFCAAGLLPAALVDSVGDLCVLVGTRGSLPGGCPVPKWAKMMHPQIK